MTKVFDEAQSLFVMCTIQEASGLPRVRGANVTGGAERHTAVERHGVVLA